MISFVNLTRMQGMPWNEATKMIVFQKFCKKLSLRIGHGKSFGFANNHPLNGKGRHHDRDP